MTKKDFLREFKEIRYDLNEKLDGDSQVSMIRSVGKSIIRLIDLLHDLIEENIEEK